MDKGSVRENGGEHLKRVAKGGAIFSLGLFSAYFLKLVIGVIVVRYIEKSEYGLISFGYVLTNVMVVLSMVGIGAGLPRMLVQARSSGKQRLEIRKLAGTALFIVVIASLMMSLAMFTGAEKLSVSLDKEGLDSVLVVFALMIPPLVVIKYLTSIFQSVKNAKPKAMFEDAGVNFSRFIFILIVIMIGAEFQGVIYAYAASIWITFFFYIIYALKNTQGIIRFAYDPVEFKNIMLFCMPLLGVGLVNQLTGWVGVILLGFYSTAEQVATYMAPSRLLVLLVVPMTAMGFVFFPIAAKFSIDKSWGELIKLYRSSTKWIAVAALPLGLYFILDAEFVVTLLFGEKYSDSAIILQITALGYCIHNFLGPNSSTLVSCGYSKIVFYTTGVSAVFAVVAGLLLIPEYGAVGVAISTTLALVLSNLMSSIYLIKSVSVHPFSKKYIAFAVMLSLIAYVLYFTGFQTGMDADAWYVHLLVFLVLYALSIIMPFLMNDISESDIDMLEGIERKLIKTDNLSKKLRRKYV